MSISALELLHVAVRNIPKFRDSCDVIELLFSRKMENKTRGHCFEAIRHTFRGKLIYSFLDIHVLHLASLCRICQDKIKDHKRKVDTNRLVSEIHLIWKDLLTVGFSKCSSRVKKKIKERRQISTANDVFRYSLNTDNRGWILTFQV